MRIISLSPSSTEILFAIGAGADVVGVTQDCNFPAEARRRNQLGSGLQAQPSVIEALHPDLIVSTSYLPEELRLYAGPGEVLYLEPTSLGSVLETILLVGRAVGRYQNAETLVQAMQRDFEEIRTHAPQTKLRVYCEAWPDPPMQARNWIPELVEIAGGFPIGELNAQPSQPVTVDALQSADPDVLVFHWCNPDNHRNPEYLGQRLGWANLRALQTNACAYLPDNLLNRPGPRLVEGARQLQTVLVAHQHTR